MTDGRFNREGNRIENLIPGNPNPNPNAPSDAELAAIRRARSYEFAKNEGTLDQWYDQNDAANIPSRKPGRGRGGR